MEASLWSQAIWEHQINMLELRNLNEWNLWKDTVSSQSQDFCVMYELRHLPVSNSSTIQTQWHVLFLGRVIQWKVTPDWFQTQEIINRLEKFQMGYLVLSKHECILSQTLPTDVVNSSPWLVSLILCFPPRLCRLVISFRGGLKAPGDCAQGIVQVPVHHRSMFATAPHRIAEFSRNVHWLS